MDICINIDVDDLDHAIAFYTALGLRLSRRLFDGAVAEMAGAGTPLHLLRKAPGSSTAGGASRSYRRHWTPVHLDFCIANLDAALAAALAAGAILEGPVRSEGWGRMATLADPFGHGLCLIELAPAGYDQAAGLPAGAG